MSVPLLYFDNGSHMSAVLKADMARVRAAHPERYKSPFIDESRMDGTGKVSVTSVRRQADAMPMSPRDRHELSIALYHPLDKLI